MAPYRSYGGGHITDFPLWLHKLCNGQTSYKGNKWVEKSQFCSGKPGGFWPDCLFVVALISHIRQGKKHSWPDGLQKRRPFGEPPGGSRVPAHYPLSKKCDEEIALSTLPPKWWQNPISWGMTVGNAPSYTYNPNWIVPGSSSAGESS